MAMAVVGISGNFSKPSRTRALVESIVARATADLGGTGECFDLLDAGPRLSATFARAEASPEHERMWSAVESCSVLVVGSPVYNASYSGLLKHFFDLFDMTALRGRPVIVATTGRAPRHALMIEHQMKPLFGFFGAFTVPTGIFVTEADSDAAGRLSPAIGARIAAAVQEAGRLAGRTVPS